MGGKVYIFGAHSRAQTMAVYLTSLTEGLTINAYLVDNEEDNPTSIDGVPVMHPEDMRDEDKHYPVYLAVRGSYHKAVEERLHKNGFMDVIPVTVSLDAKLRKDYLKQIYTAMDRPFLMIDDMDYKELNGEQRIQIYEVCSIYDKPLEKDHYARAVYETPIQVGAALTDIRISSCSFFDHIGDNISKYNKQLCEETALYWIWKHAREDIVGLVHYRRHFIMPENWVERMILNEIDVILPIPLYVKSSVENNYRFRHISDDWDVLMEVIRDNSEEEYLASRRVFDGNLYFPLNIFVMRRDVLNDYCEWLFDILFKVIEKIGTHTDIYQNRYPAFMAERLLTLYFEMNREKYNIVYADKGFLQ